MGCFCDYLRNQANEPPLVEHTRIQRATGGYAEGRLLTDGSLVYELSDNGLIVYGQPQDQKLVIVWPRGTQDVCGAVYLSKKTEPGLEAYTARDDHHDKNDW